MKRFINTWSVVLSVLAIVAILAFMQDSATSQGKWTPHVLARQLSLRPVALTATAGAQVLPPGSVFTVAGTLKQTSITTSAADAGRIIVLITASTDTLVDGSNLKLAGDFNGSADDVLTLIGDGTNWYEISRSVN